MAGQLILKDHAIARIEKGDDSGRRTYLTPQQVLQILRNPRAYIPYRGENSDGRVFFSSTDQKCLVAWLENDGNCLKVRTIENHHNRVPIHVLLQAESYVLGDIVFLKDQPAEESFADEYTVWCRIGVHRLKMPLPGYLYPGVSWWRFRKNVKNLAGFIQKHNLDGTEPIILEGQHWHDKEKRWSRWQERLPVSFPINLLKAGKSGIIPDWVAITHL